MAGHDQNPLTHPAIILLERLIERPSVTPDDAGCQKIMAERLAPIGFECESMPFGEVSNLWARRGSSGPHLCFAGHTDVVPPGAIDKWHSDPFKATVDDGLIYGRGAADMKGGLAAMIVAIERFVAENPDHGGSLSLLITSDEEGPADDGTRRVMDTLIGREEHIDYCVIGEPSSQFELGDIIRNGRRGSLSGILSVIGMQGHVAYPQLADNPIHRFAPVLAELQSIEWDEGNAHFPPTSFQVVNIEASGGAVNVTPAELNVRFNFRYSTVWDYRSLQQRVNSLFEKHDINFDLRWRVSGEPFITESGRLIDAVTDAVRQAAGCEPELSTGGGTSDGRFIAPAGVEVVELGPVNESIHKVNEHVKIDDIVTLTDIYQRTIEKLLL